jgi:heme exporter protein D
VRGLVGLSMAVALTTAVVMLIPTFLPHGSELAESWEHVAHRAHGWLALGITMPAVIGALLHGYAEKQALSEHVKQYDRMSVLFANAKQRLGEALDGEQLHEARLLLRELGREALAENGDWVLLHRQRPLEIPQAG